MCLQLVLVINSNFKSIGKIRSDVWLATDFLILRGIDSEVLETKGLSLPQGVRLTDNEINTMLLVAKGWEHLDISLELELALRSVSSNLSSARKKLHRSRT